MTMVVKMKQKKKILKLQMVALLLPKLTQATELQGELSFHHPFSRGVFSGFFLDESEEIKGSNEKSFALFFPNPHEQYILEKLFNFK